MVTSAPAILIRVKRSSIAYQAITAATGGIRYIRGAVRATPRTPLTHPQVSHPKNADTMVDHSSMPQCSGDSTCQSTRTAKGSVPSRISGAPASVA